VSTGNEVDNALIPMNLAMRKRDSPSLAQVFGAELIRFLVNPTASYASKRRTSGYVSVTVTAEHKIFRTYGVH
jgi:hypothetical protein